MDDKKLEWCCSQKKGIKIIPPNNNLAKEYMQSAEETLSILQMIKGHSNMWLATTKYYCEYFAIYALLMKIGIKCEIHDCTIELCKLLEKEDIIPNGFITILEKDKELRIDNQYYLKNKKVEFNFNELRDFVLKMKDRINSLTLDDITRIRKKMKKRFS
ncbi:hypothetical protein J4468_00350 [Candidatus Woesearchaeota archaeon]|nr:hypothetical protein [Candidatus Woesearchaeota archaeon]